VISRIAWRGDGGSGAVIIMDSSWAANSPAFQRMTARADSDRLIHAEWQAILNDPETT